MCAATSVKSGASFGELALMMALIFYLFIFLFCHGKLLLPHITRLFMFFRASLCIYDANKVLSFINNALPSIKLELVLV